MPRFSHISGDTALDLLNTVGWRLSDARRYETLTSYADLLDWCVEAGLLTDAERTHLTATESDAGEAERAATVELREAAYRALLHGDGAAARLVADSYRDALADAELTSDGRAWAWSDPDISPDTPRRRIARRLVRLLQRDDLDRLHQCEDAECGWVFLDTSPRRNRRWCVTSDCGDRNRARAYYARQKERRDA